MSESTTLEMVPETVPTIQVERPLPAHLSQEWPPSGPKPGKPRSTSEKSTESTTSHLRFARAPSVMYKRMARIVRNPLLPPASCTSRHGRLPGNNLAIGQGPDRHRVAEERQYYRQFKSDGCRGPVKLNSSMLTPIDVQPGTNTKAMLNSRKGNFRSTWAEKEERLKDYRDHLLAEQIGYETLVGNLLYIDIPRGRDINRSWQNFLSDDIMEWGFPYYKGSRDRPRLKFKEPYLAHQLKEKLWRYPKTRLFFSSADE
ncbi:hypothetical protein PoB_000144500 [Plakobranchus ocellatus]|uniref:Uncharacterized protein n=1 Tax=Plakobranchus ocellatus TaxID=259542 RepID=A0AAV3XWF4_9GAST|nr:hypothetical protein PoB_000144500 [Plakobranchus ocellatus]